MTQTRTPPLPHPLRGAGTDEDVEAAAEKMAEAIRAMWARGSDTQVVIDRKDRARLPAFLRALADELEAR